MNGADTRRPSLRSSGLKGILRFWWRAAHPNLENAKRKQQEQQIFGGTLSLGDKKDKRTQPRKSSLILQIRGKPFFTTNDLIPHKRNIGRNSPSASFGPGERFEIVFRLRNSEFCSIEKLEALLKISALLGGIGRRTRRGMGGFIVLDQENPQTLDSNGEALKEIAGLLQILNPEVYTWEKEKQCILPLDTYTQPYPFIKQIQIGEKSWSDLDALLLHIGKCTSTLHGQYKKKGEENSYQKALGAGRPRFASPVYVSVVKIGTSFHPIITQLNAQPPKDRKLEHVKTFPNTIRTSFIKHVLQLS